MPRISDSAQLNRRGPPWFFSIQSAVDMQPEMTRMLTALSRRPGQETILPVLGAVDNVKLPSASADLAQDGLSADRSAEPVR